MLRKGGEDTMAKFCTECGAPLKENAKFCTSCGKPVGESRQAAPAQEAPPLRAYKPLALEV